jgi:hypothetical protein
LRAARAGKRAQTFGPPLIMVKALAVQRIINSTT